MQISQDSPFSSRFSRSSTEALFIGQPISMVRTGITRASRPIIILLPCCSPPWRVNSLPELSGVMLPAKSKACTPQRKWVYSNMVFIKWYNLINYINLFNSDPTDLNRLLWFSRTPLKNNPNRILLLKTRNSTARSHSSPNRPQSIVAGLGNPCKPCLEDCLQKWNIEASFFSI